MSEPDLQSTDLNTRDNDLPSGERNIDSSDDADPGLPARRFIGVTILFEVGLAALALAMGSLFGVNPLATWQWNWSAVGWGAFATLPMLAGLWLIDRHPIGPLIAMRQLVYKVVVPLFRGAKLWQLAAIALAAGIGEELLFRGLLQGGLEKLVGRWMAPQAALLIALLAASLIFGVGHYISRTYAVLCFLIGIYLGAAWWWTGNLLVPVVIHTLYDFVALVHLLRQNSEESPGIVR